MRRLQTFVVLDFLQDLLCDLLGVCGVRLNHQIRCVQSVCILQVFLLDGFEAVLGLICRLEEPVEVLQLFVIQIVQRVQNPVMNLLDGGRNEPFTEELKQTKHNLYL